MVKTVNQDHIDMLREKVFQVKRWPHYNLLLQDLHELANDIYGSADTPAPAKVISFERTLLYGGKSVFAPIFVGHDYRIVEMSPESAYERGAYNAELLDNRFMEYGRHQTGRVVMPDFDLALVPNVLHHIPPGEHERLFSDIRYNRLKGEGAYLYVYEQFIEEVHQAPDDYVRYTPQGLADVIKSCDFEIVEIKTTGGIFSSAQFLLETALENIVSTAPPNLDAGMMQGEEIKKIHSMIKYLQGMDERYPENKMRPHSSCPKAFSILARVPE